MRNGATNHGRKTAVFNLYAIDRSLKNNDQKDIPLDDRNWAEARDALIIERCARAGDMPFVTDLRGAIVADYDLRGSRFARL